MSTHDDVEAIKEWWGFRVSLQCTKDWGDYSILLYATSYLLGTVSGKKGRAGRISAMPSSRWADPSLFVLKPFLADDVVFKCGGAISGSRAMKRSKGDGRLFCTVCDVLPALSGKKVLPVSVSSNMWTDPSLFIRSETFPGR